MTLKNIKSEFSSRNSESKHMYIGYISTNSSDLALIRRFDPSLTSGDLSPVMIYTDLESVNNFKSFKVYVIKIGQLGDALELLLGFQSFCSRAPPRDRRT